MTADPEAMRTLGLAARLMIVGLVMGAVFLATLSPYGLSVLLSSVAAGPLGPGLPDNPFGLVAISAEVRAAAEVVGPIGLVVGMVLAIAAASVRWRRGSVMERSQPKWLFAALLVAGFAFPLTFGGSTFEGSADAGPTIFTSLGVGSVILIPIAIGVAVLRYRLDEIDRLVSWTIAWAGVTGVLVTVFAGVVIALQAALAHVTQGETLAVAGSTLVAAALFQPVRRRVQSTVDRRFDRARYDRQRTVDAFGERLRSEVDLATLRTALVTSVDDAVRPVGATVWLRTAPGGR